MSVNMFSVDMCSTPCAAAPTAPVPNSPKKRRRKRKRGSRTSAFAGIEECVTKLEDELKQVRLQLAHQERRIAELEAMTMCPEGKDGAARTFGRNPPGPASTGRTYSNQRTAVGGRGIGPAGGSGGSRSGNPDQESQAQVSRPAQVKRKRRPRKKRCESKNVQEDRTRHHGLSIADQRPGEYSPANLDHRSSPSGRVGDGNSGLVPRAECMTLTNRENDTVEPSTETAQEPMVGASVGITASNRKYTVTYAQKTLLNRAPRVAGVDPMALLLFAFVVEIWKPRLISVLIWIM
jgi:hypothetical protein